MKNIFIIAGRELSERIKSRSFITFSLLGPLVVLFVLYILFNSTASETQKISVLVSDPIEQLEQIIVPDNKGQITYSFINSYVEPSDFVESDLFSTFDALLVVNEKVLSNNHVFLFQKQRLNTKVSQKIQRELEKRLEGLKAKEFTSLTVEEFLIVKHPLSMEIRDAYRPTDKQNYRLAAFAGYAFGLVIYVFVFLFGMTVLRSTTREKSSRISEVLLAMVKPSELMSGKLVGIGLAAVIQFVIWFSIIGGGLFVMRALFFPDMLDGANLLANNGDYTGYNDVVKLVYEQLNFTVMILFFALLLLLAYLFYGGFFAALGAAQGSESDGQQFLIPLILLLVISIWSGYFVVENPDHQFVFWLGIIPFTSPMVIMVKLGMGYDSSEIWQLLVALLILLISIVINIRIAGKMFQHALLNSGYRLRLAQLLNWMFRKS